MAGMPVGPLSLNDEVALDLGWKILKATEADLGAAGGRSGAEDAAAGAGREARPARPQERQGLLRLSGRAARSACGRALPTCRRRSSIPTRSTSQELKQRLLAVQALEAARCVEEGVITDVREADVGSILGFGFAPFSGGTLSYIDMMGTKRFVELCERLEKKYGPRFAPPQAARRHGGQGRYLLWPLCARERRGRHRATASRVSSNRSSARIGCVPRLQLTMLVRSSEVPPRSEPGSLEG